jgi:hypothetical protein
MQSSGVCENCREAQFLQGAMRRANAKLLGQWQRIPGTRVANQTDRQ